MFNKCIFAGYVGRDPEIRYLPDGKAVASFSLAVEEKWTSGGEKKSRTEWINVSCFGNKADAIGKFVTKGTPLMIEGKYRTEEWENNEGQKRTSVKIMLDNFTFLPSGKSGQGTQGRQQDLPMGSPIPEDDVPF